jgi:MurNAc alpha-1-phosphate uridylyltransferase
MTFQCLILAGGYATRLRPLTDRIPKALIPINKKPFIDWQLKKIAEEGVKEVILSLYYKSELIEELVGDGSKYGLSVIYSYDGEKPIGTGGAVMKALPLLRNKFMVLYGDSYLPIDLRSYSDIFEKSIYDVMMLVHQNNSNREQSNVYLTENKQVLFNKKIYDPRMNFIDYGLTFYSKIIFNQIDYRQGDFLDLADVLEFFSNQNSIFGLVVQQKYYEVGSFSGIKELEEYLQEQN